MKTSLATLCILFMMLAGSTIMQAQVGIRTTNPSASLEVVHNGSLSPVPTYNGPGMFSTAVMFLNTSTVSTSSNIIIGGQATSIPKYNGGYGTNGNSQAWNGCMADPTDPNKVWLSATLGQYKSDNLGNRSWRSVVGHVPGFVAPNGIPTGDHTAALYGDNQRTGSNDFGVWVTSEKNFLEGRLGIGTSVPGEMLEVAGNAKATSFIATTNGAGSYKYNSTLNMNVPDYVFDHYFTDETASNPEYSMLTLPELQDFIETNRHLPRVPSRSEIETEGAINIQGLSMITLEKTEENTLYILELNKINQLLEQKVRNQQNQIDELKQMVLDLQKKLYQ